jgi:predicted CopG family antitoxin
MHRLMTTIALRKDTVRRIAEHGQFNETYEDVIKRLLEKYGNNEVGNGQ